MTVIAGFRVPAESFNLGTQQEDAHEVTLELERIVPGEEQLIPYLWATGNHLKSFERAARESPQVASITQLDAVKDQRLYRMEWRMEEGGFLRGLLETEAVILEATGDNEVWFFRLRFPDHDHLGQFYNYCLENNLTDIQLERVYSLTERSERAREFGLTAEQREALVLSAQHGYFSSPRKISLDELAEKLDISQQAMSQRIRRGTKKVILGALRLSETNEE